MLTFTSKPACNAIARLQAPKSLARSILHVCSSCRSVQARAGAAEASSSSAAATCDSTAPGPPGSEPAGPAAAPDRRSKRREPRKPAPGPATVVATAPAAAAGVLPEVLAATWPDAFPTLSAARRAIRKDLIHVDGAVGSCKRDVAVGQLLTLLAAEPKHAKGPRVVSLQVVYEDDHLAVVHKPWGVKMYAGDGRRTVTGALRVPGALAPSGQPDALFEPRPVHRLDAAVGGVLVVAKTQAALVELSAQFAGRRVHKVYHALLSGRLEPGAPAAAAIQQQQQQQAAEGHAAAAGSSSSNGGSIISSSSEQSEREEDEQEDAAAAAEAAATAELPLAELLQLQLAGQPPFTVTAADLGDECLEPAAAAGVEGSIGSSSSSGSLWPGVHLIDLPLDGKPCYTLYQVLGHSRSPRWGGWVTTAALSPVTGRKHQLRQHMAALGCPIIGDGKYAASKEDHISNQGIYLESLQVELTHPATRQRLAVAMSEPPRLATLRGQQARRWANPRSSSAGAAGSAAGQ